MINPYGKLRQADFAKMNIRQDLVVVRALTPKDLGSVIDLGAAYDFSSARVHEVVRAGDKATVPVGARCLVLANTLDSVDSDGEFCFIESRDVYAWWEGKNNE